MYGCVALDRESVAKTPCKRRYCTDICSGDPHAREAIIAKKMDLEKEIAGYKEKLEAVKAEVIMAILSLDNPDWQKALQYRFLDDMSNQDAANKMNVDIRTVQRYVEWGCFALKLPDRFYKKPPAA